MSSVIEIADSLTFKERELIKEVALGNENAQIADNMHHTLSTIKSYRKDFTGSINCRNALQIGIFAIVTHIISQDEAMEFWHKIENGKIRNEWHR